MPSGHPDQTGDESAYPYVLEAVFLTEFSCMTKQYFIVKCQVLINIDGFVLLSLLWGHSQILSGDLAPHARSRYDLVALPT